MNRHHPFHAALAEAVARLEEARIAYTVMGAASLRAQGIDVSADLIEIDVQWDVFLKAHALFEDFEAGGIERGGRRDAFRLSIHGTNMEIACVYNTVVATDPDRIPVVLGGRTVWVKALDYYLRVLEKGDPLRAAIKRHLSQLQKTNTERTDAAWNDGAYDAWVRRFGPPAEWADKIRRDPDGRLHSIRGYLGDLAGKRVVNLLGSHGTKAIAMGLLGADATVIDLSRENARYAEEVAEAAGVPLRYIVSDVLDLPKEEIDGSYDLAVMELGILHYFVDLERLAEVVVGLLKSGGRLVLQDFHPVSTKLITSKGKKHKVTGNYFDKTLLPVDVAFSKYARRDGDPPKVYERRWTLGEIVTAFVEAGLIVRRLDEAPNIKIDDIGIPKQFTLVAEKA